MITFYIFLLLWLAEKWAKKASEKTDIFILYNTKIFYIFIPASLTGLLWFIKNFINKKNIFIK